MEYISILLLIVIGAFSIYYLFKNFNFFKRHGVIHVSSIPILGAMAPVMFCRMSLTDFINKMYNSNQNAKYFGFYAMTNKVILVRDPEIIKDILVKNFETFQCRPSFVDLNDPLLAQNLFSLHGEKWKIMRNMLSYFFTSNNMRIMFTHIMDCAVDSVKFLSTVLSDETDMDMKNIFSKYTNDVIVKCTSGIKIDSMKDPTNKFYIYGKSAVNSSGTVAIKMFLFRTFPKLARFFDLHILNDHVSKFFKNIVKSTIITRNAEQITNPDMIQLMMDKTLAKDKKDGREPDIDNITAQVFMFYLAGFESSSSTMSFIAHEIAVNTDIQIKLRREIDKVLEESNGEVTYEDITRLEYLDMVINEGLRYYGSPFLERVCNKAYELPPALQGEKPFITEKGMTFWIPVFAIHHDKKYYDDPDKFRPERFLNNKYNSLYMPFGSGPRICIAKRLAILTMKIMLFHLLALYELKLCAKTTLPLRFSKKSLLMQPENKIYLNVRHRNDMHPVLQSKIINSDAIS